MRPDHDLRAHADRIDALVQEIDALADAATSQKTRELLRLALQLHTEGMARVVALVQREEPSVAARLLDAMADDHLVASLLVLHDVHPHDAPSRIGRALKPITELCGSAIHVLDVEPARVSVRVDGPIRPAARTPELRRTIEEAVLAAVPDVSDIEIHGLPDWSPAPQLVSLTRRAAPSAEQAS